MLYRYLQGNKFRHKEGYEELTRQLNRVIEEPPVRLTPEVIDVLVRM